MVKPDGLTWQEKHLKQIEKALDQAGYRYHYDFKPVRSAYSTRYSTRVTQVIAYITKDPASTQPQLVLVHLFQNGGLDVYVTLDNSITMKGTLDKIAALKEVANGHEQKAT